MGKRDTSTGVDRSAAVNIHKKETKETRQHYRGMTLLCGLVKHTQTLY